MGSALMPIEGFFLLPASIQVQTIVKNSKIVLIASVLRHLSSNKNVPSD